VEALLKASMRRDSSAVVSSVRQLAQEARK
jgi:hypothetical protein